MRFMRNERPRRQIRIRSSARSSFAIASSADAKPCGSQKNYRIEVCVLDGRTGRATSRPDSSQVELLNRMK